ncbi:hypothetical protein BH24ACT12_BH24ACT12_06380 [soil metagenome]|jgi:hypothetical protein
MSLFDTFKKKAGEAVDQHGDRITQGLDRASGAVSKATNGKYDDRIGKGVGKAKESLDKRHRKDGGPTDGTAGR